MTRDTPTRCRNSAPLGCKSVPLSDAQRSRLLETVDGTEPFLDGFAIHPRHRPPSQAASPDTGRIEMWVLDDAEPIAEWVRDSANLDATTDIGDGVQRSCTKRNEPCESLRCVRYSPQRLRPHHTRLAIRYQAKLESADVEADVERLVEVGR